MLRRVTKSTLLFMSRLVSCFGLVFDLRCAGSDPIRRTIVARGRLTPAFGSKLKRCFACDFRRVWLWSTVGSWSLCSIAKGKVPQILDEGVFGAQRGWLLISADHHALHACWYSARSAISMSFHGREALIHAPTSFGRTSLCAG